MTRRARLLALADKCRVRAKDDKGARCGDLLLPAARELRNYAAVQRLLLDIFILHASLVLTEPHINAKQMRLLTRMAVYIRRNHADAIAARKKARK